MRRICAGVGGNLNTSAASHRCSSWAQSSSSSTSVLLSGLGVQLPLIATDPYTVPGVSGRGRQSMSNNEDGEILAYRAPHESRQHRHARRSRSRDRKRPRNRSIERRRGDRDAHRNRRDHDRRTKRTSEVDNRRDRKHSTRRHDPQSSPVRNVRVNDVKPRAADVPAVNNDIVSSNGQPDNVSVEKPNHVDDTAITKPDQNGSLSNGDEPVAYNQYLTEIAVNAAASAEDDPAYLQRVEEQIQGILGQAEVVNVEEELERRRARRRALLLALEGDRAPVSDATPNDMSDITLVAEPSQQGLIYPAIPSTPVIIDGSKVKNVSDDDVDIFGDSPIAVVKPIDVPVVQVVPENVHLIDNWDDAEGYYSFRLGDVLHDGRYEVFANQGRGVFSTVLRVRDRLAGNRELVVKVIRQNDVMYKAGLKEVNLLKILGANDPDNHRHCIRLYSHFEHRGHLCLELMLMVFAATRNNCSLPFDCLLSAKSCMLTSNLTIF
uniref:Protein kinase domain-containing protein n=1 Tax=Spongospora subterranea TaxID=70186 RepID=A0A0H5QHU3_9EUKA|eukprot:CRZ01222.1 hypothetical protein [Spongospora subterranea]